MFQGSMVALVTPMTSTGEIDLPKFRSLVEMHIQQKTDGIVVIGTTGECPTITESERNRLIEIAVETSKGQVPIIVGTGSSSTMHTIYQTQQAMELGADACLIVTPYYNRPTQEGLFQHFKAVAEAVAIPIILYNVASRTACDLLPETVERLSHISNIIGIKEASGDLSRGKELHSLCKGTIDLYSGDDSSALAFILQGGKGVISVTANIAPKAMHEMCKAALEGNIRLAGELNTRLMPLHKALGVESNPIPVKWALNQLGWIQDGIRLPLTSLSEKYQIVVKEALQENGVL
jgi:4-hydroxy-tetrahydrodipicolinate synthase